MKKICFNFGKHFQTWIDILYKDTKACIYNNGYSTGYFQIESGIKQGCPVSALLFILVAELIAIVIRNEKNIKGIKINEEIYTICQLADDTCLFIEDISSLEHAFSLFKKFETCSGLKVNIDKSEIIPLGEMKYTKINLPEILQKLKICLGPFKTLGIWFSHCEHEIIDLNFNERLAKMRQLMNIWHSRGLSWKGRITIIKTLILPQIQHLFSMLFVSQEILTEIEQQIYKFLWAGKPPRIRKEVIIAELEEGGLKMPYLKATLMAAKISWIKRLLNSEEQGRWKSVMLKLMNVTKCELTFKLNDPYIDMPASNFHRQLLSIWFAMYSRPPINIEAILNEKLILNKHILIQNSVIGRDFNNKICNKILRVADVVDENRIIMSRQEFERKQNATISDLTYNSLNSAIPKSWKSVIHNKKKTEYNIWDNEIVYVSINNRSKLLSKTKTKEIYWEKVNEVKQKPKSIEKWIDTFPFLNDISWKDIYLLPYKTVREPYLQTFQYKILNRTINCRHLLYVWKLIDSPNCVYCDSVDTIEHHFFLCNQSQIFWNRISEWLFQILEIKFRFTICEILLGIPVENDNTISTLNLIILLGKSYINMKRSKKENLYLFEFITIVKEKMETYKLIWEMYNQDNSLYGCYIKMYENI